MVGDTSLSEKRQGGSVRHGDGVFWVDEGVEKTSLPLWKRGRVAMSERQTSSDFGGAEKDFANEKWNRKKDGTTPDM